MKFLKKFWNIWMTLRNSTFGVRVRHSLQSGWLILLFQRPEIIHNNKLLTKSGFTRSHPNCYFLQKRGLDRSYRSVRIKVSYRTPFAKLLAIAHLLEKTWIFRQNECPFWVCRSAEYVTWKTNGGQVYAFQSAWLINHRNLFNFLTYRFEDRPVFKKLF